MNRQPLTIVAVALSVGLFGCPAANPAHQPTMPTDPVVADVPTPTEPTELVFPTEEFRAAQPAASAPRAFQLPEMKTFTLANGIKVYLVESHKLPVVSIDLDFEGGSMNDPRSKPGLAGMCMGMLTEGTAKLGKIEYNEALADTASGISSYADNDTQGLSMYTMSKHFDATFALFVDTLLRPGFRQVDFDRRVARTLEALKQRKASAPPVASRLWQSVLYGTTHPFGKVTTEKGISAMKLSDCKRYHKSYLKPKGARLFVFGDLDEEQIRKHFGAPLAAWKGKPKASVKLPKPRSRVGKLFFVDIPGSAQSMIFLAHFGPKRFDKDYFANEMLAAVLGSSFSSRINMNLREDKGYAYGAFGTFYYSRNYGTFLAGASVQSSSTWQSIQEIYREVNNLHAPPAADKRGARFAYEATAAELEREKNGAILSLPGNFATAGQALSRYRRLVYFGLPLDTYASFVQNYAKVSLDQVNAAARKHLRPDDAVILVVGDAKAELKKHVVSEVDGKSVKKDEPLLDADGKPVLLIDGLNELVKSGALGAGKMVVLDADGKVLKTMR